MCTLRGTGRFKRAECRFGNAPQNSYTPLFTETIQTLDTEKKGNVVSNDVGLYTTFVQKNNHKECLSKAASMFRAVITDTVVTIVRIVDTTTDIRSWNTESQLTN